MDIYFLSSKKNDLLRMDEYTFFCEKYTVC